MQFKINNYDNLSIDPKVSEFCKKVNLINSIDTRTTTQKFVIDESVINKYNNVREFFVLSRLKFNNFIFKPFFKSTWSGKRNEKRPNNDCFFSIEEEFEIFFGRIHTILSDGEKYYFLFRPVETCTIAPSVEERFLKAKVDVNNCLYLVQINNTLSKYVSIGCDETMYLTKIMYKLHVD